MSYTIMFYNLENLYDTSDDPNTEDEEFTPSGPKRWTTQKYQKKLENLAEVISTVSNAHGGFPVVIGVSEVENLAVMQDLADQRRIRGARYRCIHYESNDVRGVDVGLFYRPDKFKLEESCPVKLELRSGREYIGRDILFARGKIDGEMFCFYVCHLPVSYTHLPYAKCLESDRYAGYQHSDRRIKWEKGFPPLSGLC